MLAARDLATERSPEQGYRPDPRRRASARPRTVARPRSKAAWLGLWALAVLVAFSVTYRHAALTRLGYEAKNLERQLAVIRKLNGELEVRVSSLGAPARVQQLAQSRLGMVQPQRSIAVAMAWPAASGAGDRLAAAGGAADVGSPAGQPESDSGGMLSRLWRFVRRLTGVPAEAAAAQR